MITLTRDEFQQKYGTVTPEKPVTISKEEFNKRYGKESFLKKTTDFFTRGTQKFGETLGAAASVIDPKVRETREEALSSSRKSVDDLMKRAEIEPDKEKSKRLLETAKQIGETEGLDVFENEEYKKTAKQVFGEGLETFLELTAFSSLGGKGLKTGKIGKELPTIIKPLTSVKDTVKAAKTGIAYGGGFGAALGAAEALQEDKSAGEIAKESLKQGLTGAIGGGVIGGGASALFKGAGKFASKASKLSKITNEKIGDAAYNKLIKTSRDLVKMSPTQTRNEARWGKDTPKFLVDEGVVGLLDTDGKRIVTEDAVEALRDKYSAESRSFNKLLSDTGQYVSLDELERKTLEEVTTKLKNRGSDLKKAKKEIIDEIVALKENYREDGLVDNGDLLVPITDFNRIKSGLWSKTSNFNPTIADKLTSDTFYKMGQTAKDIIESTVDDVAIKRFNRRLGDFASALKVLEKAEGKVLPGGFFGKAFTRIAGTVAGTGGGVIGSVIGNMTGGVLADIMMNPKFKTGFLSKLIKAIKKTPKGQSIIDEAEEILMKRGKEREGRLLLKEAKTIVTPQAKDASRVFTQEEANTFLKELGTPTNTSKTTNTKKKEELKSLKETKDSFVKSFLDSEEGLEIFNDLEKSFINKEEFLREANAKVISGVKNSPFYRKEKEIKDLMGEGWLMEKNGKSIILDAEKSKDYQSRGWEKVVEVDTLAQEAGFDSGYDYLNYQLELSGNTKSLSSPEKLAHEELLKLDPVYADLDNEIIKLKEEIYGTKKEGIGETSNTKKKEATRASKE